jgi:cobalt-zinc-cadmium efflux system membrane fusion protein
MYEAAPELHVTGTVSPDVSRSIPVVSLSSGRIVDTDARLGDTVKKGQLLMRVQRQDISQAFSDYRQAVADETLANTQLTRSKNPYEHGAVSQNDLQVTEDAETKAKVTLETTLDHLRILGADSQSPTAIVEIRAPASGVITDQQVTAAPVRKAWLHRMRSQSPTSRMSGFSATCTRTAFPLFASASTRIFV